MEERSMPNDSYFLPCWQRRTIDFDEQKDAEKADTLRFCLSQLRFLQSQAKSADSWILDKKIKETFFEYSKLVDSKDKLNNYAAPILSQSKSFSKPNESKKWKCHLNSEDLKAQYLNRVKKKTNDDHNDDNEYIQLIDWIKQSELAEAGNLGSSSSINQSSLKSVTQRKETTLESQPTSLHVDPKNLFAIFGTNKSSGLEEKDLKLPKMERKVYPWEAIQKQNNLSTSSSVNTFRTASQQLMVENARASGSRQPSEPASNLYGSQRRSLGARRGINSKFIPPVKRDDDELSGEVLSRNRSGSWNASEESPYQELMQDERLKNIDAKMVELIMNEIMDSGPPVSWDDIAGLELAKNTIKEIIVWPMLRPDIFTGLRRPPKGILLFGPPGTGKTMIGKCIASQSHSTFFSISASSLTSKWVGDGEKMVRAMFAVARCHQPAVIFIDEIDSLLIQRSDTEHESSRRIKTEFLVQLDGATSDEEDRLLVVGATNRPQELDEAARRRLVKRLYIPLPGQKARQQIIVNLLVNQKHDISSSDIEDICSKTEGYSGADMANLCREAALGPIRAMNFADIERISIDEVRPITADDFVGGLRAIRASVSHKELNVYEDWNCKYGINQQM